MSEPTHKAVFLSYASQDAEAAKRICEALRAAGVEVWFDQSELVGGDAWDQKIRKQIKDCALLIPIISQTTQGRREAYFRLEWRLADERTHLMAKGTPFLLPVTIDETNDRDALVPDSFLAVQWTKAPAGEMPPAFTGRVKKLLGVEGDVGRDRPIPPSPREPRDDRGGIGDPALQGKHPRWLRPVLASAAIVIAVLAVTLFNRRDREPSANAAKPAAVAPAGNTGSRPEVAALLARVRAATDKIDILHTELDTMEGLLDQAAKLDPADAAVWAQWAMLDCIFLDKYYDRTPARRDAARRHAAQAAGLDPDATTVRLAQAKVMNKLSDDAATKAEATKILQRLLLETPTDGRVPLELGWLAFDLVRPEASLEWFGRAAQVPGYGGHGHFARARMLVYSGRTDQAGAEFDRALESGRSAEVLLWKAYILTIWNGDLAAARRALEEVPPQFFVEDMPAATRYYNALLSRNYDQALAAVRTVPHDYLQSIAYSGPTGYFAGNALALAGKPAAAELEWRSALATVERRLAGEPNDRALMEFKALLQAALGDREAGRKTWQAARELYGDGADTNYAVALHVHLLPADEAFAWLDRVVSAGENLATAAQLRLDPVYDPIRSDPRFVALLAKAEADPRLSPMAKAKLADSTALSPSSLSLSPSSPPLVDAKSVAVLAFANLSDDKNNEYFSDGISEELLNVLAKIPGLKVTARTSSFHFKGMNTAIPEIAQQLGVAYVIEGSVRKSGDKVRITAQLIKAADGFHVWSDTFTRDLKDIFAVQDEIAGLIAQQLQLKLGVTKPPRVVNPESYRLALEARYYWNQRGEQNFDRTEELLNRALAIDPEFPQAHAALADLWVMRAAYRLSDGKLDVSTELRQLRTSALRAAELDPSLAEPHAALAYGLLIEGKTEESRREFTAAFALSPDNPTLAYWHALFLQLQGDFDAARPEYAKARVLDPKSFIVAHLSGQNALALGRLGEAIELFAQADANRQGGFTPARGERAIALWLSNRREEALADARAIRHSWPGGPRWEADAFAIWILRQAGLESEVAEYVRLVLAGLPEKSFQRGYALTAVDRFDEALPYLERNDTLSISELATNVIFDRWRDDPRFKTLLEKLHWTEQYAKARAAMADSAPAVKK